MAEKTETEEREDAAKGDAVRQDEKLDKVLSCLDAMAGRMDKMEARQDAEEESRKADAAKADEFPPKEEEKGDAEEDKDKPEETVADKKDGEPEDEKTEAKGDEDDDKDEKKGDAVADSNDIRNRIDDIERRLPRQISDAEHASMADAQARADPIFQAFGDHAPRPMDGEDIHLYRRRLARTLQKHSPTLKEMNLSAIQDAAAFNHLEGQIYADAAAAAANPVDLPAGVLRSRVDRDTTGRQITTFFGEPKSWLSSHGGHRRRARLVRPQAG